MKILKFISKSTEVVCRIVYFLISISIIVISSYLSLGYSFLVKGAWGTDMANAFSIAAWVDKYFPHVPFWYPLAGGGVSITHSYPIFSFYLVSLLKRLTGLTLIQSFSVLGYLAILIMAIGIYIFVWLRLKSQTGALIASFFYIVSPIASVMLTVWGFYSEVISYIFVMPAIIFWDLFYSSFIEEPSRLKSRIYLIFTIIFLSLTTLVHYGVGLGLLGFFAFYIIGYLIKEKNRKTILARGMIALGLVAITTFAVTLFSYIPYRNYGKAVAPAGISVTRSYEQIQGGSLNLWQTLGFERPIAFAEGQYYRLPLGYISFSTVASVFAIIGILISFKKSKWLAFSIFSIFCFTLSINPRFNFFILNNLPPILTVPLSSRWVFVPLRMVWPALASIGAIEIFKLPFFKIKADKTGLINLGASVLGLMVVIFSLSKFGYFPGVKNPTVVLGLNVNISDIWNKNIGNHCGDENDYLYRKDTENLNIFKEKGYGKWCHSALSKYFDAWNLKGLCDYRNISGISHTEICNIDVISENQLKLLWLSCKNDSSYDKFCDRRIKSLDEQLKPNNWPKLDLLQKIATPWPDDVVQRIADENPKARIDFSTFYGSWGMMSPYFMVDKEISQIYIYTILSSSLINRFVGQEVNSYYIKDPQYGDDPNYLNNIAKWFGLNYVFFEERANFGLLEDAGWKLWERFKNNNNEYIDAGVLKYSGENKLADLSQKPTILVNEKGKPGTYDQIYLLSGLGFFPYDQGNLVWEQGAIDNFKLEELKKFDAVLLHGYTYKNKNNADKLLTDYVTGGGNLFIDTGWQYENPDWQTEKGKETLQVIPFTGLTWESLAKDSSFVVENQLGKPVDPAKFSPLTYYDMPWGVSTGERKDLKSWAKVILSSGKNPLVISGSIGRGKVVWSGMNIFAHAKQAENINYEEINFLNNIFSWLTESAAPVKSFRVDYFRPNPDEVDFKIEDIVPNGGFLLWKESFYPDFKAKLISGKNSLNLDVYRGGPSLALIKVPKLKPGDTIIYKYQKPLSERIGLIVSIITFILILPFLFIEALIYKRKSILSKLSDLVEKALNSLNNILPASKKWWSKDDEDN